MDAAGTLALALESCVLADRSGLGRLRATGRDILDLLNRLGTQDLRELPVGSGAPTVLTSAKGRIVERLFVHRLAERELLLVAGPGRSGGVLAHVRKYTFSEDTGLSDATAETAQYALVGPSAAGTLAGAGVPDPGPHGAGRATLAGTDVVVLGEDGFGPEGRSIVVAADRSETVRDALAALAPETDAAILETWRILRGFPGPGAELTEDWNPLEAGLRDHVSFTKGCYVGQEVVARLNTYAKVSRRLVVVRFPPGTPPPGRGAEVVAGERAVGRVTSAAALPDGGAAALAYVKARDVADGAVRVGEASGTIVNR